MEGILMVWFGVHRNHTMGSRLRQVDKLSIEDRTDITAKRMVIDLCCWILLWVLLLNSTISHPMLLTYFRLWPNTLGTCLPMHVGQKIDSVEIGTHHIVLKHTMLLHEGGSTIEIDWVVGEFAMTEGVRTCGKAAEYGASYSYSIGWRKSLKALSPWDALTVLMDVELNIWKVYRWLLLLCITLHFSRLMGWIVACHLGIDQTSSCSLTIPNICNRLCLLIWKRYLATLRWPGPIDHDLLDLKCRVVSHHFSFLIVVVVVVIVTRYGSLLIQSAMMTVYFWINQLNLTHRNDGILIILEQTRQWKVLTTLIHLYVIVIVRSLRTDCYRSCIVVPDHAHLAVGRRAGEVWANLFTFTADSIFIVLELLVV